MDEGDAIVLLILVITVLLTLNHGAKQAKRLRAKLVSPPDETSGDDEYDEDYLDEYDFDYDEAYAANKAHDANRREQAWWTDLIAREGSWCSQSSCTRPSRRIAPGDSFIVTTTHEAKGTSRTGPIHPECLGIAEGTTDAAAADQEQPTDRYGEVHQRERARWAAIINQEGAKCTEPFCVMPTRRIETGAFFHLSHDHVAGGANDYLGPSHPECNEHEARLRGVTFERDPKFRTAQPVEDPWGWLDGDP